MASLGFASNTSDATSADSECASNGLPGDPTVNTPKVPTLVK